MAGRDVSVSGIAGDSAIIPVSVTSPVSVRTPVSLTSPVALRIPVSVIVPVSARVPLSIRIPVSDTVPSFDDHVLSGTIKMTPALFNEGAGMASPLTVGVDFWRRISLLTRNIIPKKKLREKK